MTRIKNFKNILIVGATSAIATETAKLFTHCECSFFLIARNEEKLNTVASDLSSKGASKIGKETADLNVLDNHFSLIQKARDFLGNIDLMLIAHGSLPNQKQCEQFPAELQLALSTNFLSIVSIVTAAANVFEQQENGTIAVISSVAGDRGRKSNYIYGAAKGGTNIFLQGLRNRLHSKNIQVLTIKPGFVNTPLTKHISQNFLFVQPEVIAKGIVKALATNKHTVYLPSFWRLLMLVIRSIPECIFKRLSL